ncbi:MAG: lysylphosphatidylglycerol synthase transmembrane domain-containing protein [Boseongicola sp.]
MKYWRPALAAAIATALIVLLVLVGDLKLSALFERLTGLGAWWILIIVASFIQIAISAEKWRIVLGALANNDDANIPRRFFVGTSAIAALSSQFLTVYAASIFVRSVAGRVYGLRIATSAGSSGFEQLFDVAVLFVFFVPTVVTLLLLEGILFWVGLAILSLAVAVIGLAFVTKWVRSRDGAVSGHKSGRFSLVASKLKLSMGRDKQRAVAEKSQVLFSLSVIRFVAMFFRAAVVAWAAGYIFDLKSLILAFTAAQASQLASLTPGNLGIFEWSWAGILAYLGNPFDAAIEFAILLRICSLVSIVLVTSIVGLLYLREFSALWQKQQNQEDLY